MPLSCRGRYAKTVFPRELHPVLVTGLNERRRMSLASADSISDSVELGNSIEL